MWGFYFNELIRSLPFFLKGLWMTFAVSGLSLIFGTIWCASLILNAELTQQPACCPLDLVELSFQRRGRHATPWPQADPIPFGGLFEASFVTRNLVRPLSDRLADPLEVCVRICAHSDILA